MAGGLWLSIRSNFDGSSALTSALFVVAGLAICLVPVPLRRAPGREKSNVLWSEVEEHTADEDARNVCQPLPRAPWLKEYIDSGSVQAAYALGLADLRGDGPLGDAPYGLFFVMPFAVAAVRGGNQYSQNRIWPEFDSQTPPEREAIDLIQSSLEG